MDTDTQDATPESSTGSAAEAETTLDGATSSQGGVPAQNLQGEFNRKFGVLQRQLEQLAANQQALLSQQAQTPQYTPQYQTAPSDEQLWEAAKQGSQPAFEEYQRRIAQREIQGTLQHQNVVSLVDRQMAILVNKYPVLNDASHPLTQAANVAFNLLSQSGFPRNRATMLEAAKLAITDNPDLVADLHNSGAIARDQMRRSATQVSRAGVTGVTYRQGSTPQGQKGPVPKELQDLANKMGVKDPAGSMKRFKERRDKGISNLGAIGNSLDDSELQ